MVGIGWFLTHFSQAGPPFVTDDPEPPPPGGWEVNIPFILERTPGVTEMDAPLFDLNYGVPGIQLKLEIPVEIIHNDSDGTVSGAGDLLLGVKWRFLNNEQSQFRGKWTVYGEVGYWWQTAAETRNYVYAGAVVKREINERLELGVEFFGNSPKESGGRSELAFNVGGTWKLNQNLNLLFSGGRDIVGDWLAVPDEVNTKLISTCAGTAPARAMH